MYKMSHMLSGLLVLLCLAEPTFGHGAMKLPRPRNNELNATHVMTMTNVRIVKTKEGLTQQSFVHGHGTCTGPVVSMNYTDGKCLNYLKEVGLLFSTKQPASTGGRFVDCTPHNDCSAPSRDNAAGLDVSGFVWFLYYQKPDCSGEPLVAYKMNLDACTTFPGVQLNSTTVGCEGLSCLWFSQGCGIGCSKCTEDNTNFFTSPCNSTKQPTINDPKLRTFNRYGKDLHGDWTASHPWRAPGSAPVLDPCGMAGGSTKNNDAAAGFPPAPGHKMGDKGSQLAASAKTQWTAGSTVEVEWGIWANHGGGYQYRLCPKSEPLTEECFQRMPLPFAGALQKLRLGDGAELEITATRALVGTLPEGSEWAMNPVPACSDWTGQNCSAPQFPPPPGCDNTTCWGYLGAGAGTASQHALPTIVDRVMLPESLVPGDYVLGWRWDCEQTPQIWASCADVVIVKESTTFV